MKNLSYSFYRFDKEKNIQIFKNAGWHFNNLMPPEEISLKLKTFAHKEFSGNKFSSIELIKIKLKIKVIFLIGVIHMKKLNLINVFRNIFWIIKINSKIILFKQKKKILSE